MQIKIFCFLFKSPDYYKVITKPIDLSVIKEKLHSLQYSSAVDFVKDFRLMISNCRTYNQVWNSFISSLKQEEQLSRVYDEFQVPLSFGLKPVCTLGKSGHLFIKSFIIKFERDCHICLESC